MRIKSVFIVFLVLVLVSLACTFPTETQSVSEQNQVSSDYPDSPEGVVRAFLIAYQEGAENLAQYVKGSSSGSDAVYMLDINGMMMSFIIQSASVRPDPPGATIEVGINLGDQETVRVFNLAKEDEQWVIISIENLQN